MTNILSVAKKWSQVIVILAALGLLEGFRFFNHGERLEALEGWQVAQELDNIVILRALARLECISNRDAAILAGIPCHRLINNER